MAENNPIYSVNGAAVKCPSSYLWKQEDAKNPDKHIGVLIAKTWYWYDSWVKKVREYCEKNIDILK